MKVWNRRRLLVVPVNISRAKRYMLAYQVESRNGLMYKHLLGSQPFGVEQLPEVVARVGKVTDVRSASK